MSQTITDLVENETVSIHGAELSRRGFIAAGGSLAVAVAVVPGIAGAQSASTGSLDATRPASWIEIHADNSVVIRTGKCDFGQSSIYTAYRQAVAEELSMPFSAMKETITGDTDRTPDGGGTFGLLRFNLLNLRKAAAYTREAVLDIAARKWGVARGELSIKDGVISGGGKSATYGELVSGSDFQLTIPVSGELTAMMGISVTGNPPLKPAKDYTIVGQSFPNPIIRPKVSGEAKWVGDVKLPGMLHARMVMPATLGSKLIEAGKVDTAQYPGAKTVVIGNLVAVVSPNEWEAVQAAMQVAGATKWTEWKGLPGSDKLPEHLATKIDWKEVPPAKSRFSKPVPAGATPPVKTHKGTYFMPYFKHAPIGPMVTLADVKPDGSVMLHTHSQNPQYLRSHVGKMLGTSLDKVVVRTYPGSGHYGRSNGGSAGSENEAVLLSRELGKPVRVQYSRADEMQWSTNSSCILSEITIGLDAAGNIATYESHHRGPPMQDDRPTASLLAGLPAIDAPGLNNAVPLHRVSLGVVDAWVYGAVPAVDENGHGMFQLGQRESPIAVGMRDHSMRTPIQFQQNFPRECALSEAAALGGKDALQFRIDHTTDPRVKAVLERLRQESGWDSRPSPAKLASAKGAKVVRGRGVSMMLRDNGYWACAAHVAVTPSTGEVKVERITLVTDPGIMVNPLQLKRQAQAGLLMGVSQTLHEEVTFDEGAITNSDWATYPILTMGEMPEVKVVLAGNASVGNYGQGSESANALAAPAIAGAFFDATGKPVRRLPLTAPHVKAALA